MEAVVMLTRVWMIMTCVLVLSVMDVVTQQDNKVFINVRFGESNNTYMLTFTEAKFVDFYSCLCEGRIICQAKYNLSDLFQVSEIVTLGSADTTTKNPRFYKCQLTQYYPGIICTPFGFSVVTSEVPKTTVFMFSKPASDCDQKCVGLKWTHEDEGLNFSADIEPFIRNCDVNCSCPALTSPLVLPSTSSLASTSTRSSTAKTSQGSRTITTSSLTGRRYVLTDSYYYNTVSTSASSHKPVEPTAHTSKAKDDDGNEAPIGMILGAVAGVIVVAVIVIVIVVMWKRRNREPKPSDYSSKTDTRSTSSGHTEEQNKKRTQGKEPHYVNTTPSNKYQNTKVTNEQNVGNSPDNTILQQDDTDDNNDDFDYYTTHTVSSGNNDNGITNDTMSTTDTTKTQQNRTSDDYGYSYAEDQSSGDNITKPNKDGPSVVVTINQNINIKSSDDDYEDVYTGDEIPSTDTKYRSKNPTDSGTSPSRIPQSNTKEPEDEYAVVNKSRSVAKGDTASESIDVYSKLHETERHITNPYDSLHHLNISSNVGNQPDSTHASQSANQGSPYELAQPIPGTSANENGSAATEVFELVPFVSSTGRKESDAANKDQKNGVFEGKKQAKKLPYGPEDYAVVIKNKPSDKNKAAGFELGNM